MDDSGRVVVAATKARLASVAAGLSLVTESAAAHGRSESSIACSVSLAPRAAPGSPAAHHASISLRGGANTDSDGYRRSVSASSCRASLAGIASVLLPLVRTLGAFAQVREAMGLSSQKSLLVVVLTHGSVAGFSAQRFGPLRPRAALHPLQQSRTVVAAGAIDLAANATKGLVEGVVRTVTDNEEYQFGKPRHRRHDSPVPLAQAI